MSHIKLPLPELASTCILRKPYKNIGVNRLNTVLLEGKNGVKKGRFANCAGNFYEIFCEN